MQHSKQKPARRAWSLLLLVPMVLGQGGCSHTEQGMVGGGVGGGIIGGLAGKALGNTAAGAAIGAATGAVAGGVVGNRTDRIEQRAEQRAVAEHQAVQVARGPLGLEEIAKLAQSNVSDEIILDQIRLTNAVYTLTPDHLVWLKQNGVSDRVIRTMQSSGGRPAPVRYATPPTTVIYEQRPVYFAPPPPPPPIGVGIGVRIR